MMISWKSVVDCFSQSKHQIIRTNNYFQKYWNQKTLFKGMSADDSKVLYLIQSNLIPYVEFKEHVSVVILVNDVIGQIEIPEMIENAIVVSEAMDEPKGIMQLNALFQNKHAVGYILQELQIAIASNQGIQEMIEILSRFFEEPVSLLDTSFRFIARSETYKPISGKSLFPDVHFGVGYNKEMIHYLKSRGYLDQIIRSTTVFSLNISKDEIAYYIPIMINNIKIAYLIIYSNKPESTLSERYQAFLPHFSALISVEMAKSDFYLFNKGTYYNYIFSLILSEEHLDVEEIRMRLQLYNYDLREYMYLVEIDMNMYQNIGNQKNRVADLIRNNFRNSFYIYKDDKLYFLISRDKQELVHEGEMNEWARALKSQNLVGAITGPFTDFDDMSKHIKEVELVLEAEKREKDKKYMVSFNDYQIKAMILNLQDKQSIDIFLYKPVLDLIRYDELHGSELVLTLKEYLKNSRNINEICNTLCIHRNTLYKRLDKIDSIMQCNYHDGKIVMRIELTFEMLDIMNN